MECQIDMPDRMSEYMPDNVQIECQKICQIECQKICQIECQKIWQTECQKMSEDMRGRMPEDMPDGMSDGMNWMPWWITWSKVMFYQMPTHTHMLRNVTANLEVECILRASIIFLYAPRGGAMLYIFAGTGRCAHTPIASVAWLGKQLPCPLQ